MLLFASLAEALGRRELVLAPDERPGHVGALRHLLAERWPDLARHAFRVAVDRRYAGDEVSLEGAAEVALIPPVSGG